MKNHPSIVSLAAALAIVCALSGGALFAQAQFTAAGSAPSDSSAAAPFQADHAQQQSSYDSAFGPSAVSAPSVSSQSTSNTGNSPTQSTNNTPQTTTLSNPLKVNSIGSLAQTFVEIFSYIAILFAVLLLIWTGLQFVMAKGNAERMKELKNQLLYIVIGVAVVIGARVIIQVVINTLSASGAIDPGTIQSIRTAATTD